MLVPQQKLPTLATFVARYHHSTLGWVDQTMVWDGTMGWVTVRCAKELAPQR